MESTRLLDCFNADFHRLRDAVVGADLTDAVPSCPGWTVRDLVVHLGEVYLHKVECMRLGHHPEPWPPASVAEDEPLALFDRAYGALTAEFAAREPSSPAYTWYEPEQTVGFWIRRMAQETAIHRVDAELGAGVPITSIPADLAADGIDEFLRAFVEYGSRTWPDEFAKVLQTADGRAVRVQTPDVAWLVRPTPALVEVTTSDVDSQTDPAVSVVAGDPAPLLLWLWNRAGDGEVTIKGDTASVSYLREVLAAGAQ